MRQLTLGSVIFQLVFFDAAQSRRDCVEAHMISYGFSEGDVEDGFYSRAVLSPLFAVSERPTMLILMPSEQREVCVSNPSMSI
jgi:hypothetical protein